MRGCQLGNPLKSRIFAQTLSIGAGMTEEMKTCAMDLFLSVSGDGSLRPPSGSAYRKVLAAYRGV
ncbi:hypothetical protein D3C71_2151200 [compost metagenome]